MDKLPFVLKDKEYYSLYQNTSDLVRILDEVMNVLEHSKKYNKENVHLLLRNMKRLHVSLAITENKVLEKLNELNQKPGYTQNILDVLMKQIETLETNLEKKLETLNKDISTPRFDSDIISIITEIKKLEKISNKFYKKKIKNKYIVSDRDFIAVLEFMKKHVSFGKIKPLPKWARNERKLVIKDLSEKIQKATDVSIAKSLTEGNFNLTDLAKRVPSSSATIRKAIKNLEKERKIKKLKIKNKTVYKLYLAK